MEATAEPQHQPPSRDHRVTLTVAGILFMLLLDSTILNTSLPAIAASQHVQPLALSAAVTVYLLAGAAVLPLSSWLADRFGLRRVFVIALTVFTLASVLCGVSESPAQLVLSRLLQGIGGGMLLPTGRTIAMRRARREDVISITALLTWPALFAPVLGPPLGGFITTYASWRWNFWLNLPIGLASMLLVMRWVPAESAQVARPFDWQGALGAALGLTLLIGGLEWIAHAATASSSRLPALLCVAAGLAALAWTVRHLHRTDHPVVSLAPFRHRTFVVATSGGTVGSMCIQATPFLLPLLFQLGFGRDAVSAGAMLLPYFLGNLGMKSVTTPILRRFGFRRVLVVDGTCSALAIASFALVDTHTPWWVLAAMLLVAGCARSMLMTAINTLMYAEVQPQQMGPAATLSAMSMQMASAMGVALGTIALATSRELGGHAHLAIADFHAAFLVVAAVNTLALVQFWRLPAEAGADVTGRRAAS